MAPMETSDAAVPALTLGQRFAVWRTVINTANLPEGMAHPPDAIVPIRLPWL